MGKEADPDEHLRRACGKVRNDILISTEGGTVARLTVRNLEVAVKQRLQRRTRRHGLSLEEEIEILRAVTQEESQLAGGLGTEIASLFKKCGLNTSIAELRGPVWQSKRPLFRSRA